MTGAKIAVKCLLEQGVKDIFGYPGASILPLIDAIDEEKRLKLYINAHEQFSAFAADGYARSSGHVGVCIATSGPGATNLVTGIANAYMDSIPLVAITGNVPLSALGTDAFQEVDIAGITMPITKHNFIVKSVDKLAETLRSAFKIANTGRKGPVLVDIPSNVFTDNAKYVPNMAVKTEDDDIDIDISNLDIIAKYINNSSSPAVCVGGGVIASGAEDNVRKLVDKLCCPVVSTAMGIGAFDQTDPRYRGLLGLNITDEAVSVIDNADLFIAVGVRFSDRMLCSLRGREGLKVVHIDIDAAEIDKNLSPFGALVGDANKVLDHLLPLINRRNSEMPLNNYQNDRSVYGLLNEIYPDAIYTTEVGLHQTEACRRLRIKRSRSFITAGGLGAMGFGLPSAVGAAVANDGKRVINIAGDGSFNMNIAELGTAVKYKLPLIQIVINNRSLGMIEKMQSSDPKFKVCYCDLPETDYSAVAKAFGADYFKASGLPSMEKALLSAKDCQTVLIEYVTEELI